MPESYMRCVRSVLLEDDPADRQRCVYIIYHERSEAGTDPFKYNPSSMCFIIEQMGLNVK